jgi:gliding motility-associated-like protein
MLYYIPNSFTPDGDEHNNVFNWVFTSGFNPASFTARIYNRWGELIFVSHDPNGYWDGSYGASYCPDGVYVYQISFGDKNNDGKYMIEGFVTMLR